jgi:2-dehydro-3-deoxyphosphooctonate aldolase (KDO 8-P synthase)
MPQDQSPRPRDYCYLLNHRKYNRNQGCRRHDNLYGINGGGGERDRWRADRDLFWHMRGEGDPMAVPTLAGCLVFGWFFFNYHAGRWPWHGQLVRRFVRAPQWHVQVGQVTFGADLPFVFISGPCQIESRDHAFRMAEALAGIAVQAGVPLVFKSSYDKANRTSGTAVRGVGIDEGLRILGDVRAAFGIPVLTDVHDPAQARAAGEVVDVIQIPAFLCRQTDLLVAAGETGKAVNVKKGQFLAPDDMVNVAAKIAATGNERILLTERGVSFGYHALVSDFRALPIMAESGFPVVFDATHSVQEPGGRGGSSGGNRTFAPALARAALAVGCAAVFAETHDDPDRAPSDGPNMLPLHWVPQMLAELAAVDRVEKARRQAAYR